MPKISHPIDILPLDSNSPDATHAVIMMHGYGADGFDLLMLGQMWQRALPHLAVFSLQAPWPCEPIPGGWQWFPLSEYRFEQTDKRSKDATAYVHQALEACRDHTHIPTKATFLMGFSQGAMMALGTLYHCAPGLAGVLAYSGGFVGSMLPDSRVLDTPICLIHGDADDVVPVDFYHATCQQLAKDGFTNVQHHLLLGLSHSIDGDGLGIGEDFLRQWS